MVFGQNLKILTSGKKDTMRKSRGPEWRKFQLPYTFHFGYSPSTFDTYCVDSYCGFVTIMLYLLVYIIVYVLQTLQRLVPQSGYRVEHKPFTFKAGASAEVEETIKLNIATSAAHRWHVVSEREEQVFLSVK